MSIAEKLQIKGGRSVSVLHAPPGMKIDLPEGSRKTSTAAGSDVVIVFVSKPAELANRAEAFVKAAHRDALAWIAYPKSGQLDTDLNRDSLWELLQERGSDRSARWPSTTCGRLFGSAPPDFSLAGII
jgi:hypothetical protein